MKTKFKFLAGALLGSLAVLPARAQDSSPQWMEMGSFAQQKIALEKTLEEKAQGVLDGMLGPGKAKVVVNLAFSPSITENMKVEPPRKLDLVSPFQQKGYPSYDVNNLPGFQAPPSWESQSASILAAAAAAAASGPASYSRSFLPYTQTVKRIDAMVLVDPAVSDGERETIKSTLAPLLGIQPERLDSFVIQTTSFIPSWKLYFMAPENQFRALMAVLVSFVGLLALVMLYKAAMSIAWAMSAVGAEVRQTQHAVTMAITPHGSRESLADPKNEALALDNAIDMESVNASGDTTAASGPNAPFHVNGHFSFLTEQTSVWAADYLKNQSPMVVGLVVASVDPDKANIILERLPENLREQTLSEMSRPLYIPRDEKQAVAQKLQEFLQTYTDTPAQLRQLFNSSSPEQQEQMVLQLARTNPEVAQALEACIVRFEDLAALPEEERALLVTSLPIETFVSGIKKAPLPVWQALIKPLPKGLKTQIEQHVRYMGSLTDAQVKKAQAMVIAKFQELRAAGKIGQTQKTDEAKAGA